MSTIQFMMVFELALDLNRLIHGRFDCITRVSIKRWNSAYV